MNWFKKNILGIDVGHRTLRGVRLKRESDGRVVLTDYFFQDLARTTDQFPEKCNREEVLRAAIETNRLSSAHASTAIPNAEVMSFQFDLPEMSEKSIAQAVPAEIVELSDIAIEDHVVDYVTLKEANRNRIKAYAVKRDLVMEQMQALEGAGLKAKAIEPEMNAIAAMLEFNDYLDPNEVAMVVDIGDSHITTGLIADGQLMLNRSHQSPLGKLTQELQERFQLGFKAAERIKTKYDFFNEQTPEEGSSQHVLEEAFTSVLRTIKEALDFYRECPESYGRIDRVLLLGGGSRVKNIVKVHEMVFKVPTTIVNPFRNIDIFTSEDPERNEEIAKLGAYMGTAVGLALASVTEKGMK